MFSQIKGYEDSLDFLKKSIVSDRLVQSYLFYGANYQEILSIAREFSRALLCQKSKEENCDCLSCERFNRNLISPGAYPEFLGNEFEWGPHSKQGDGVKSIREILHQLGMTPMMGTRKVAILRYVDYFNKEIEVGYDCVFIFVACD